ncbi:hypothetical protein ACO0LF_03180 [Undibacterium sp. Di27W]
MPDLLNEADYKALPYVRVKGFLKIFFLEDVEGAERGGLVIPATIKIVCRAMQLLV